MTAKSSTGVASPSAPAEGIPHGGSEPGGSDLVAPPQYGAPLSGALQQQSVLNGLARSVAAGGEGSDTARKSSNCCTKLLARISSGLSWFSPIRSLCGRALSYLTAQAVILAVVNGTIISFSSPLTAVPVICAIVDELWSHNQPQSQSLILESLVTAMIAAGTYATLKPFKEHMVSVIPMAPSGSNASSGVPGVEIDYSTAIHLAAGVAAYISYRITHATQRCLYRP